RITLWYAPSEKRRLWLARAKLRFAARQSVGYASVAVPAQRGDNSRASTHAPNCPTHRGIVSELRSRATLFRVGARSGDGGRYRAVCRGVGGSTGRGGGRRAH